VDGKQLDLSLKIKVDAGTGKAEIVGLSGALDKLEASGRGAGAGLGAAGQGMDRAGAGAAAGTGPVKALGGAMESTSAAGKALETTARGVFAALAGFSVATLAGQLKDTAADLQDVGTRLKYFSGNAAVAAEASANLWATAKRLNTDYHVLADSYGKLLPLQKAQIVTAGESQAILEGLTNTAKGLGASNAQLGQSFFGLTQALASPIVRAEELNQVVEPLPGLLQAMDRAAQLPAGGFRQMVNDGKATAEFFKTTLIQAFREFDGAAAASAENISGASQRMKTAWQETAAAWEQPINVSMNGLATFVERINTGLQLMAELAEKTPFFKSDSKPLYGKEVFDYMAQVEAQNQKLFGGGPDPSAYVPAPLGFVGPVIDEEISKARQKAAKKAAEDEAADARTVNQSKIELLKTQGQYAEALRLEAEVKGLAGARAKEYVRIELATIQAKAAAKAATKSQTAALKEQHEAETLLTRVLEKQGDPWQKHVARMAAAEKAMAKVTLTTEQYQTVSLNLNRLLDKERKEWSSSDEAMAGHVKAYEKQQEAQAEVIAQLQQEAKTLRLVGVEKRVYLNLQKAGVAADSEAGRAIATLTRETSAAADAAEAWETAWKRSIENVQDAISNGLYDLISGRGATGFLDNLASTAARITSNQVALTLQEVFRGISAEASGASSSAGAISAFFKGLGNGIAGLFGFGGTATASLSTVTGGWGGAFGGGNAQQTALWSAALGMAAQAMMPARSWFQGQPDWMRSSGVESLQATFSALGDVVGSIIPVFKLLRPAIEFEQRLGASMYPDRRPSTAGTIVGLLTAIPGMPAIFGRLFGEVVKSSIGYAYTQGAGLQQNYYHTQNGAPVGALQAAGAGLGASLTNLSRSLGIAIPDFTAAFENRGARMRISGYEPGGTPFYQSSNFRITDINVEGQTKLFLLSIMQRQKVLKQFDDFLVRSAVAAAQSLDEVNQNAKAVAKIRAFEGETGSNAAALGQTWKSYTAGMDTIERIAPGGKRRRAEVGKLDAALTRQFGDQVFSFQQAFGQAAGTNTSADALAASIRQVEAQFRDLSAQNQALADLAKRSKGKLHYTALTADQLAAGQKAALRNLLIDSSAFEQAKASVADLIDSLQGVGPTVASLTTDIDTGLADLAGLSGDAALTQVGKITDLARQRFALELNNYTALLAAAKGIKSNLDALKLSGLSPLTPTQRLQEAKSQYGQTLLKAQAGDATAMQSLYDRGQQYLSEARSFYASSPEYTRIYEDVMAGVNLAADNVLNNAEQGAEAIQKRLADTIDRLENWLQGQVDQNTELAQALGLSATASASLATAAGGMSKAANDLTGTLKGRAVLK
jgi:tape measure domain-containing protein